MKRNTRRCGWVSSVEWTGVFDDDKRPLIIAMPMFPGTLVRGCSGCFEDNIPQPNTVMVDQAYLS